MSVRLQLACKGAHFEGAFAGFFEHVARRTTGVDIILTKRQGLCKNRRLVGEGYTQELHIITLSRLA